MYSQAFKAKMIQQALMPGAPSITDLARAAGIPQGTVWNWVHRGRLKRVSESPESPPPACSPQDRSAAEKLRIVRAAANVADAELGAFLRREGVHEADLAEWRRLAEEAALASLGSPASEKAKGKSASKRIRALEAELRRKDKALAETAALLILKKKALAIWGDEADDTSLESDE